MKRMKEEERGNGIFNGTFLDELQEIAATKRFGALALIPVEDGQEVIGEMNDLETACFTLRNETALKMADCQPGDLHRVSQLKNQAELLNDIGWQLIKDRLGIHDESLSFREGRKIVKMTNENPRISGIEIISISLLRR